MANCSGRESTRALLAVWALAAGLFALPSASFAACPSVPVSPWWDDVTPQAVEAVVEQRFAGQWPVYVRMLERLKEKANGGPDAGLVETKLAAVRCLAAERVAAASLAAFDTEAGEGETQDDAEVTSGATTGQALQLPMPSSLPRLRITTRCNGTDAQFRITNLGGAWPETARFNVIRADDGGVVAERRMRLRDGQTVSFNITGNMAGSGMLELEIIPSWDVGATQRASVKCK